MVARPIETWQSGTMTNPTSSKTPMAGGFILASSVLVGALVGATQGQSTLGFLAGLGIGLAALLIVWLRDRRA